MPRATVAGEATARQSLHRRRQPAWRHAGGNKMNRGDHKQVAPASSALGLGSLRQRLGAMLQRAWDGTASWRAVLREYWDILISPSRTLSLGLLTIGGFLGGVGGLGGLYTPLPDPKRPRAVVSSP